VSRPAAKRRVRGHDLLGRDTRYLMAAQPNPCRERDARSRAYGRRATGGDDVDEIHVRAPAVEAERLGDILEDLIEHVRRRGGRAFAAEAIKVENSDVPTRGFTKPTLVILSALVAKFSTKYVRSWCRSTLRKCRSPALISKRVSSARTSPFDSSVHPQPLNVGSTAIRETL
jgi:hypothetical protein